MMSIAAFNTCILVFACLNFFLPSLLDESLISLVSKHANFRKNREYIPLSKRMNIHEVILFSRQLSTLIESGIPLESSLKAITEQAARSGFKTTVAAIQSRVNEGYSLSESLVSFPPINTPPFELFTRRDLALGLLTVFSEAENGNCAAS